ncbi:unnamed protein product, partial [Didymodactylos carnosus]
LANAKFYREFEAEYEVNVNVVMVKRRIDVIGKQSQAYECAELIRQMLEMFHADMPTSTTADAVCPICMSSAEVPYNLQACGHLYCRQCLYSYLESKYDATANSESLKIVCQIDECQKPLLVRDIKSIAAMSIGKLAKARFQAYLREHEEFSECFGIDCKQLIYILTTEHQNVMGNYLKAFMTIFEQNEAIVSCL